MNVWSCSVFAVWFACVPFILAEEATNTARPSNPLEAEGLDAFYNLEYDKAIAVFHELRDTMPNDPTWQNHLASAYFYKQMLVAGMLQGDLFTSSNGIFHGKKTVPDAALEKG